MPKCALVGAFSSPQSARGAVVASELRIRLPRISRARALPLDRSEPEAAGANLRVGSDLEKSRRRRVASKVPTPDPANVVREAPMES